MRLDETWAATACHGPKADCVPLCQERALKLNYDKPRVQGGRPNA
jgi:NAD-dependent dihydropyrimidine dehydrogenase PreA subunit